MVQNLEAEIMKKNKQIRSKYEQALESGELSLHYQPIVDAETHITIGAEALLRWLDDDQKAVFYPDQFIPLVEEDLSLMLETTKFVVQRACADIADLQERVPNLAQDFRVNVNISPSDIVQQGFVKHIQKQLSESAISPENLGLEITERQSLVALGLETIKAKIIRCREQGIHISMDDVGTGHSTVNSYTDSGMYDTAKLDKLFPDKTISSKLGTVYTEAVVKKLHEACASILVEGIETQEQAETFRDLGVDKLQGYYFAKPMPFNELVNRVATEQSNVIPVSSAPCATRNASNQQALALTS